MGLKMSLVSGSKALKQAAFVIDTGLDLIMVSPL